MPPLRFPERTFLFAKLSKRDINVIADPDSVEEVQQSVCRERDVDFVASSPDSRVGFAKATKGRLPIHGLRHPPAADTNGWYIWCGEEFSEDRDFFASLHTFHLYEDYPQVVRLLGLAPGSRFLLAGDYLDVWFDSALLNDA